MDVDFGRIPLFNTHQELTSCRIEPAWELSFPYCRICPQKSDCKEYCIYQPFILPRCSAVKQHFNNYAPFQDSNKIRLEQYAQSIIMPNDLKYQFGFKCSNRACSNLVAVQIPLKTVIRASTNLQSQQLSQVEQKYLMDEVLLRPYIVTPSDKRLISVRGEIQPSPDSLGRRFFPCQSCHRSKFYFAGKIDYSQSRAAKPCKLMKKLKSNPKQLIHIYCL